MKVYELPQRVTELLGFTEFHNMIGRERSSPKRWHVKQVGRRRF